MNLALNRRAIYEAVASLSKMLRRIIGEDAQLQLRLHAGSLLVHADASMLDQVLLNLAVNARDAMPDGGCLLIETAEKTLASTAGHPDSDAAPAAPGGTETILLAEDDPALRLITRRLLQKQGYTVVAAANGPEALQLWAQHRQAVALLLTDLVMPGGVTGQHLARQLQADKPGLKVIYTSGYSPEAAHHGLELRPGENFVPKPYPPNQLLESVRRCLDI